MDDLKAILDAATPGPWIYSFESVDPDWAIVTTTGGRLIANVNADGRQEANACLIAMAPDLAAEVLRLRAENERLNMALDSVANWMDDPEAPGTKSVGGVNGAKAIARAALAGEQG